MVRKSFAPDAEATYDEQVKSILAERASERRSSYNGMASLDRTLETSLGKRLLDFRVPAVLVADGDSESQSQLLMVAQ